MAMCDGSARFVGNAIDPSLWHVLHSRETPAVVLRQLPRDTDLSEAPAKEARSSTSAGSPAERGKPAIRSDRPPYLKNVIGIELVRIRPGEFTMGTPDLDSEALRPEDAIPHRVRITRVFYIGKYEVTQQQFKEVMGINPSYHSAGGGAGKGVSANSLPVENVTWYEAEAFCKRLSSLAGEQRAGRQYRLPTEAEWEYCCRAGSSSAYPFKPQWHETDPKGEIAGKDPHPTDEPLAPQPVGSYPPNPFGLYDMRGNVFEWCSDWFNRSYYRRSPVDDPEGPQSGYLKVVRGWDWVFIGGQCKDFHVVTAPDKRNRFIGFRIVASADASH